MQQAFKVLLGPLLVNVLSNSIGISFDGEPYRYLNVEPGAFSTIEELLISLKQLSDIEAETDERYSDLSFALVSDSNESGKVRISHPVEEFRIDWPFSSLGLHLGFSTDQGGMASTFHLGENAPEATLFVPALGDETPTLRLTNMQSHTIGGRVVNVVQSHQHACKIGLRILDHAQCETMREIWDNMFQTGYPLYYYSGMEKISGATGERMLLDRKRTAKLEFVPHGENSIERYDADLFLISTGWRVPVVDQGELKMSYIWIEKDASNDQQELTASEYGPLHILHADTSEGDFVSLLPEEAKDGDALTVYCEGANPHTTRAPTGKTIGGKQELVLHHRMAKLLVFHEQDGDWKVIGDITMVLGEGNPNGEESGNLGDEYYDTANDAKYKNIDGSATGWVVF